MSAVTVPACMRRRRFIGALTAGFAGGAAGCLEFASGDDAEAVSTTASATGTPVRSSVDGVSLPVPASELRQALPRDHIPAIVDPAFAADWRGFESNGESLRLPDDAPVLGVERDGRARAYPFPAVAAAGVVNDRVGDLPVAVSVAPDGTLVAYDRRVGRAVLRFEADGDRQPAAGGSRWDRASGRAVDGAREGRRLERANDHPPMFWFGWSKFNPETDVYGRVVGDE
jgi:hypothetical protein